MIVAATPAPQADRRPPAAPPNGTYTYELSRNGGKQGTATVVIFRRDERREIETDEAGSAGAARMAAVGAYRYADLGVETYVGTYQAPFLRESPLGRAFATQLEPDYFGQVTVRYRAQPGALAASVDGTALTEVLAVPAEAKRSVRVPWLLDGPFMTGPLLLPAFHHRSGEALLAPVSEAFPGGTASAAQRVVRATPTFPKTPKSDLALDVPGVANIWFDPATYIVHEVHFTAVNFDARLVSYVRAGRTATYFAEQPPVADAPLPRELAPLTSADGTTLVAVLSRPVATKRPAPVVVLVPPGPGAPVDYRGDGPHPMFRDVASALVARGYAVLRYDMRGVGKSSGTIASETWDQARADVTAAVATVAQDATLDAKRVYVLGFGNGADLALAAASDSASGSPVAGAVALAPTVRAYRDCPAALAEAQPPASGVWRKSAFSHDPTALAARTKVPLLILHPGEPVCNESKDLVDAYDDRVRAANPRATIVTASDLTARFGSRYEAEAPIDTEAFFPYRFDASTATAIADWLDSPKTGTVPNGPLGSPSAAGPPKPPPPPGIDRTGSGLPDPHLPTPKAMPTESVEPGVVLPSGTTPPAGIAPPTPLPTPAPSATP